MAYQRRPHGHREGGSWSASPEHDPFLFSPSPADVRKQPSISNLPPRYLFRVHSSRTGGINTSQYVKSAALASDQWYGSKDFFSLDPDHAGNMLLRHLLWEKPARSSNLISWTSSLLAAITMALYRDTTDYPLTDNNPADIKIVVLDTTKYRRNTFVSAYDLVYLRPGDGISQAELDALAVRAWKVGEYFSQGVTQLHTETDMDVPSSVKHHSNHLNRPIEITEPVMHPTRSATTTCPLAALLDNGLAELYPSLVGMKNARRWETSMQLHRQLYRSHATPVPIGRMYEARQVRRMVRASFGDFTVPLTVAFCLMTGKLIMGHGEDNAFVSVLQDMFSRSDLVDWWMSRDDMDYTVPENIPYIEVQLFMCGRSRSGLTGVNPRGAVKTGLKPTQESFYHDIDEVLDIWSGKNV